MGESNKNEIRILLKKLFPGMAVLAVFCWCITLLRGFRVENLLGFIAGFLYVCLCCIYLGRTCVNAVELDIVKAKRAMLRCYLIRYAGLFLLCCAAAMTGLASLPCVLIPQFFPKIVLMIMQFVGQKG